MCWVCPDTGDGKKNIRVPVSFWKHFLLFPALLLQDYISRDCLPQGFQIDSANGRQWDKIGRWEDGRIQSIFTHLSLVWMAFLPSTLMPWAVIPNASKHPMEVNDQFKICSLGDSSCKGGLLAHSTPSIWQLARGEGTSLGGCPKRAGHKIMDDHGDNKEPPWDWVSEWKISWFIKCFLRAPFVPGTILDSWNIFN